jgi:D-3-phosphoglycerate dehydrogenase
VDEQALIKAAKERGIRCGLDVYQSQPATPEADWTTQVTGIASSSFSHHIGASTDQAQGAVAEEVVRIVRLYSETGHFNNCVNEEELLSAKA